MRPIEFNYLKSNKFGRLSVITKAKIYKNGLYKTCIISKCDCGKTTISTAPHLTNGLKKSCGCLQKDNARKIGTRHGMKHSLTYNSWQAMKQRCDHKSQKSYNNYGGRGVKYQKTWSHFKNFLKDMGIRPSKEMSLDRIDPYGDYTKTNCRWADRKTQANNKRQKTL